MFRSQKHLLGLASQMTRRLSTATPTVVNSIYIPEYFPVIDNKLTASANLLGCSASMPYVPIHGDPNLRLKSYQMPAYTGYGPLKNHHEFTHRREEEGVPVIGPSYRHLTLFEDSVHGERFADRLGMQTYYNTDVSSNRFNHKDLLEDTHMMQVIDIQLINGQFIGLRNNTIDYLPSSETNPVLLNEAFVLAQKMGPAILEAGYHGTLTARFHVNRHIGWIFESFRTQLTTDHLITDVTSNENLITLSMQSFMTNKIPVLKNVLQPDTAARLIPILACNIQPEFHCGGNLAFRPCTVDRIEKPTLPASHYNKGEVVLMQNHGFGFDSGFNGYGHNRNPMRPIGYILGKGHTQAKADENAALLASQCLITSYGHRLPLNFDYAITALKYLRENHYNAKDPATKDANEMIAKAHVHDLLHRPLVSTPASRSPK